MISNIERQKIKQYKARRQAASKVTMHPPFAPDDHLVGIYDRDDTHPGFNGVADIMVVKTEDDQEVGVWRNVYVNKAIELAAAHPGQLVSIKCIGTGVNAQGNEYPLLDINFDDL